MLHFGVATAIVLDGSDVLPDILDENYNVLMESKKAERRGIPNNI